MKRIRVHFIVTENGFVDLEVPDEMANDVDALWEMAMDEEMCGNAHLWDRELYIKNWERN